MSEPTASVVNSEANMVEPTKSEHETITSENEADEVSHINGDAALVSTKGAIRRLPIPSSDPNDPLNFPKWMKIGLIISSCWFATMSLALIGGLGAILGDFFGLYMPQGFSSSQIVLLLTLPSLFTGIGNYIMLPFALAFGRRPAFLVAATILVFATVGAGTQKSYHGHLAARIFQGLSSGATESLLPLMLSEITFMHQRAYVFGAYWSTQTAMSSLLNTASSYEAVISWRWYYGVFAITAGVGLVLGIFFGFETRYQRPAASLDGQIVVTDHFGVTRILDEDGGREYLERNGGFETNHNSSSTQPLKTYAQFLNPWPGMTPNAGSIVARGYVAMLEALTCPGIWFAILAPSITLGVAIAISLTYNNVLEKNYNWPAKNIGLINLAPIPASYLAMLAAGWGGDKITVFMAKRNGGIAKPEYRLIPLVYPLITGLAGILIYSYTADNTHHNLSWAGPVIGWAIYEFAFVCTLITSTSFAAEAWPKNPGPALVVVVGSKNFFAFGISYALTPMVNEHGYTWAFGILAGCFAGVFCLGVPIYFLNPLWRKWTSEREARVKARSFGRQSS
ncbi:related to HOL1 protein [Phialocephala subalpina]|uniref:Related to HOL1 protein n=1 Tax=Phialocephala subalpina TaxID=576137 RepID=A0A1L7XVY1_9HELO|nr:related to HOL1 protein [Phialocephala subalpina]